MDPEPHRIEICPNCSLSVRAALLFFGSLCAVSFTIAGIMASQGFWPVLPFAGLEMAGLGWALMISMERRHHSQTITVTEASVSVELRHRQHSVQLVFPRHWAQVKLRRPASRLHPSRLTIESHGRQCELGSFLTEAERRGLALRLQGLIGRVNESPSLA
ncbi:MAG TPA: DUF2244 domain-containing protein [Steroidobacteraceae bacterium]|nr:DUF2244 domain-containing protein [Steroidobacteraceae bacterium]